MMKRALISVAFALACLLSFAGQPDSLAVKLPVQDWPDTYLDTVKITTQKQINDYSMIGVNYGVSFSMQYFNPSRSQDMLFTPRYVSVLFSHYEKMFNYLPYFGYQVGLAYSSEGYRFKTDKNTGKPSYTIHGASSCRYDLIEVPFMIQGHFDSPHFRFLINLGMFGGYRLKITREGESVDGDLVYAFSHEDRRWDYGLLGGAGFALVFKPVEIHFNALGRYSLSSLWDPATNSQGEPEKYYYRFANPIDIMVTVGLHFHLTKRTGKTSHQLRMEAKDIVYGKKEKQ